MAIGLNQIDFTKEKICSKCFHVSPLSNFYKDSSRRDGLSCWCKDCHRKREKEYYRKHREEKIEHALAYQKAHPEKHLTSCRKYYAGHKEYFREREKSEDRRISRRARSERRRARMAKAICEVESNEIAKLVADAERYAYCGASFEEVQLAKIIEHVTPLSRGGGHALDNLAVVCQRCNSSKGSRLLGEWLPFYWFGPPPEGNRDKIEALWNAHF